LSPPGLAFVPLAGDLPGALAKIPGGPGVGQILSADGRSLVVGVTSSLRRWAASQLGLGKKPAGGRRPKLDLSAIAAQIGWVEAEGAFRQRLLYERLLAPLVPLASRRDLKPPVFLHLEPRERFPRVTIRGAEPGLAGLYGPFRDRRAAEKARDALHRVFALRACDALFEPDPALPLGVACLYAQVRSCAAPCLARVSEDEYRALAERAAAWLADPRARQDGEASVPPTLAAAGSSRALVLDAGRAAIGLFPVRAGRVLEQEAVSARPDELEAALGQLQWPAGEGADDWPWLLSWLRGPRRRDAYLLVREDEDRAELVARVRAGLPERFGGTLGTTRGEG
jgi:hypothetical protein